jgi:hypothetical protein
VVARVETVAYFALGALLAAAGCGAPVGERYDLQIDPTAAARAQAQADNLRIELTRRDNHQQVVSDIALPTPRPPVPWQLEVRTASWGAVAIDVRVLARAGETTVAEGEGAPAGSVIRIALADVADGGDDMSAVDLLPGPDLGCANPQSAFLQTPTADTQISSPYPDSNYGGNGALVLTTGAARGLFRFDVSGVPVGARITGVALGLGFVGLANECGGACGDCNTVDTAGILDLYFLQNAWNEPQTTWNVATTYPLTRPWNQPGAEGTSRSELVGTVAHGVHSNSTIVVSSDKLALFDTWRQSGTDINFEVVPTQGTAVVMTKEWTSEGCSPGLNQHVPTLRVDWCADGGDL